MKSSVLCNRRYLFQYLATVAGSFSVITSGITQGWTSPYLPQILNGTYPGISMTSDEGSWCAVMPLLGVPPGTLFAALLADRIGRKHTTLALAPSTIAMYILLAFAKATWLICLARFVIGSAIGGFYTVLPMYYGEISHPSVRGILTSSLGMASIIGLLFINIMGLYCSIFVSSLICALTPLIHCLTFMWMPESPYYYIKKGRKEDAEKSLKILRGSDDVAEEMKSLCEAVTRQESTKKGRMIDLIAVRSNRKACFIFAILSLTKTFSGKTAFTAYTVMIFQIAGGSLSTSLSVIVYICIEAVAALGAPVFLDRVGRRPVTIVSATGCAISLFITGLYFFLKDQDPPSIVHLGWLPLTALTLYSIFYNMGLQFASVVYLGELFPTNIKAIALGLGDTFAAINGAVTAKLFQILADSQGMFLPFWFFSGACVTGLIFIIKCVPETKNKTLEEIQLYLIDKTTKGNP